MRNLELLATVLGATLIVFTFVLMAVHVGLAWDDIVAGLRSVSNR